MSISEFLEACEHGNKELVKIFIKEKVDIHADND